MFRVIVRVVVFIAAVDNISVLSWWSVLLVEETRVPADKTTDLFQVIDKIYHIMLYQVDFATRVIRAHNVSKSNYHTIKTTTPLPDTLYTGFIPSRE